MSIAIMFGRYPEQKRAQNEDDDLLFLCREQKALPEPRHDSIFLQLFFESRGHLGDDRSTITRRRPVQSSKRRVRDYRPSGVLI